MRTMAAPTHMKIKIDDAEADEGFGDADMGRRARTCAISQTESGEAMKAPPPKPMMAMPVAMPGRSGNHLISVDTGEM